MVQSEFWYMKEEGGPKRLLLWAIKTRPNPMIIPPISIIEIGEFLVFRSHAVIRLFIVKFISSNTVII